jgi:hypothetical protein
MGEYATENAGWAPLYGREYRRQGGNRGQDNWRRIDETHNVSHRDLAIVLLALGAWLPGPGGGIFVQAPALAPAKYLEAPTR